MKYFKKYKKEIFIFIFLTVVFFLTRLYKIMSLPIFTDEAIYTRWSQIARLDAGWRFISLTDGKQPMFVWLDMITMKFVHDPLLAGRVVSVFAGFATMIGLFFLGREVFKNRWVGIISSLLYLIYPFALVYDRMALYDTLVGTFAVWSLYFEIILVRRLRLDVALILGMVAGLGVLTKTSGFFSIYLLPFTLIIFNWKNFKRNELFRWTGLALVSVVLTYVIYSILRLSPFFHIIDDKNAIFVYPFNEWLSHPFTFLIGNLHGVIDWLVTYMTWPVVLLVFTGFFVDIKKTREKILLFIWFAFPFFALALFGKVLYPRFIFFMTLSLLPIIALVLYNMGKYLNKVLFIIVFLLFFVFSFRSQYLILTNFAKAPIPFADLEQYINSWPAGGGINEVLSFLSTESTRGKIYVASEGTFGSLPTWSVEIYLNDNKNIDKRGIWPVPAEIPEDLRQKAKTMPVYFIFNQSQNPPPSWPLKLIAQYKKGVGDYYIRLYRVLP